MPYNISFLSKEFQKHTDTEDRYLVEFWDNSNECPAFNIGSSAVYRTVKDQSEIVPLLRELNKSGLTTYLGTAYDLKVAVAANGEPVPVTLKPETLKAVESFYAFKRQELRRREWDNQPWTYKLFSKRP